MSQKEWRPESVTGGKLVVGGEGPVESFVIDGEEHIIARSLPSAPTTLDWSGV